MSPVGAGLSSRPAAAPQARLRAVLALRVTIPHANTDRTPPAGRGAELRRLVRNIIDALRPRGPPLIPPMMLLRTGRGQSSSRALEPQCRWSCRTPRAPASSGLTAMLEAVTPPVPRAGTRPADPNPRTALQTVGLNSREDPGRVAEAGNNLNPTPAAATPVSPRHRRPGVQAPDGHSA